MAQPIFLYDHILSMEYYTIKSHPYTFQAEVSKARGQPTRIKFGGKKGCVDFTILPHEVNPQLEGLFADSACAVANDTQPKQGLLPSTGTVVMLKAAITFLYALFPRQKDIFFIDSSHIDCIDNTRANLHELYLVKHLKTWYQDKFNATTLSPTEMDKINTFCDMLKSEYTERSFDEFSARYLSPHMRPRELQNARAYLAPIYAQNTTYHGFIKEVAEHDCLIFDKWLTPFVRANLSVVFSSALWVIHKQTSKTFPPITFEKTTELPAFRLDKGGMDQTYLNQYGGYRYTGKTKYRLREKN